MVYEKIVYGIFITGAFIAVSDCIKGFFGALGNRFFIRRSLKKYYSSTAERRYGLLGRRIMKLLESSGADRYIQSPEQFALLSLLLFLSVYLTSLVIYKGTTALLAGLVAGAIPYIIVSWKLGGRRLRASREGDVIVHEILNNYRIESLNMKEAIETTALSIENCETGKVVLMNLARNLNTASSEDEINRALDVFRFSFNTAWGNILASNIFLAVYRGVSVENSLSDLADSMVKSRKLIEHGRRENYESGLILKFLFPITCVLSFVAAVRFFGFTPAEFFRYQFGTDTGMRWFVIMMICYGAGLAVNRVLSEEKMDI